MTRPLAFAEVLTACPRGQGRVLRRRLKGNKGPRTREGHKDGVTKHRRRSTRKLKKRKWTEQGRPVIFLGNGWCTASNLQAERGGEERNVPGRLKSALLPGAASLLCCIFRWKVARNAPMAGFCSGRPGGSAGRSLQCGWRAGIEAARQSKKFRTLKETEEGNSTRLSPRRLRGEWPARRVRATAHEVSCSTGEALLVTWSAAI